MKKLDKALLDLENCVSDNYGSLEEIRFFNLLAEFESKYRLIQSITVSIDKVEYYFLNNIGKKFDPKE